MASKEKFNFSEAFISKYENIVPPIAAQKLIYYIVSFRLVEATPLCFLLLLYCFYSNNAAAAIVNTATARLF